MRSRGGSRALSDVGVDAETGLATSGEGVRQDDSSGNATDLGLGAWAGG